MDGKGGGGRRPAVARPFNKAAKTSMEGGGGGGGGKMSLPLLMPPPPTPVLSFARRGNRGRGKLAAGIVCGGGGGERGGESLSSPSPGHDNPSARRTFRWALRRRKSPRRKSSTLAGWIPQ